MTSLKSLNFAALPKTDANPIVERRNRAIIRLEEQKVLLTNPNYVRKVRSFAKVDGIRKAIENDQRVTPWWRRHADGSYLFSFDLAPRRSNSKRAKRPLQYHRSKSFLR